MSAHDQNYPNKNAFGGMLYMLSTKMSELTWKGSCHMWSALWHTMVDAPNLDCNKKAVLTQRWSRNAPYIWAPGKFSGLADYVHGYFCQLQNIFFILFRTF